MKASSGSALFLRRGGFFGGGPNQKPFFHSMTTPTREARGVQLRLLWPRRALLPVQRARRVSHLPRRRWQQLRVVRSGAQHLRQDPL